MRCGHSSATQQSHLERAVELAPSNADILATSAWISGFVGVQGPEPLQWADRALVLNPTHPQWYHVARGVAAYQTGEDALAVEVFLMTPKMTESILFHAAAGWRLGNFDAAQALIAEHLTMAPDKTLEDHFATGTLTRTDLETIREMAGQLGLPLNSTQLRSK